MIILLIAWEYVTWLLLRTSIRRDISSPSTSDNEPRIAYIWMYVSWDRYRDTYLDIWVRRVIIVIKGSVIAIVVIIVPAIVPVMTHAALWLPSFTCRDSSDDSGLLAYVLLSMIHVFLVWYSRYDYRMICNSDSICLGLLWYETRVYLWGFPCLDYSSDVSVS